jgi:hypothetical protein
MKYNKKNRRGAETDEPEEEYKEEREEYDIDEPDSEEIEEVEEINDYGEEMKGGRRRRRRGGQASTSAATYELNTLGDANTQWNNVFNNPQTMNAPTGTGLWSADLTQNVADNKIVDPTLGKYLQSAGKKYRKHKKSMYKTKHSLKKMKHHVKGKKSKTRRAGGIFNVIGQAIVPGALLAMQQTYKRRKNVKGNKKTRHFSKK